MGPQHEQALKSILRKSEKEFRQWVGNLSEEELTYVEWLLDKADTVVDELLLDQHGLVEANVAIQKIIDKGVQ